MARAYPNDAEMIAISHAVLSSGIKVPDTSAGSFLAAANRFLWSANEAMRPIQPFMPYCDDAAGSLTLGVLGGKLRVDDAELVLADGTAAMVDDSVNYVYLTFAGGVVAVGVNQTGFPATPNLPIAIVSTGAVSADAIAGFRPIDIQDLRGRSMFRAPSAQMMTVTVEDLAAGASIALRTVLVNPNRSVDIVSAGIALRDASAGIDDGNTVVINLLAHDGVSVIATVTLAAANVPAAGAYVALGTFNAAIARIAAGDSAKISVTCGATADLPAFDLVIGYRQ